MNQASTEALEAIFSVLPIPGGRIMKICKKPAKKKPASSLPEKIEDCEPDFLQLMNMKLCPHNDDRYEKGTGELFDVINGKTDDGLTAKEAM